MTQTVLIDGTCEGPDSGFTLRLTAKQHTIACVVQARTVHNVDEDFTSMITALSEGLV